MAMDFFEHQDRARRQTGRLVLLFALSVIATIVSLHVLIGLVLAGSGTLQEEGAGASTQGVGAFLLDWRLLLGVGGVTILIVGGGSLFKLSQLSAGGKVVAEQVGGRPISPDTRDPDERKILNVVEEMSIASGVPMPPVYIMNDEPGINAFAAGFKPEDAVIGVTRGCVQQLSRDELQGVMAHEFSHILNGDMRLNLRLMGVLHGIILISLLGNMVMRMMWYSGAGYHSSRNSKDSGGGRFAILAIGLIMMLVGYIGWFFGTWIKSAVSRQREFLADASAVQFTRNPGGISGALKRILGHADRSRVKHPKAAEASHMFFGQGMVSMFATHPPLPVRIRRIEPSWDGSFPQGETGAERFDRKARDKREERMKREDVFRGVLGGAVVAGAMEPGAPPRSAIGSIGSIDQAHLGYAQELLGGVAEPLRLAARDPYGARALVHALLLDSDEAVRAKQIARLDSHADRGVADLTRKLAGFTPSLDQRARLPLLDIAIGTLRSLTPEQYKTFKENLTALVAADQRIELFEWILGRILEHHLDQAFNERPRPKIRYYSLAKLGGPCSVVLSTLARVGHSDRATAQGAVAAGAAHLGIDGVSLLPSNKSGLDDLDRALDTLASVAPKAQRPLVEACAICVAHDREVGVREAELLRAIADSLGIPVPPVVPGQPLL